MIRFARIRLFLAFSLMAWASLWRPKVGLEMVEAANYGAREKRLREHLAAVFWQTTDLDKEPQPFVCTGDELRCFDGNGCECELSGRKEPQR